MSKKDYKRILISSNGKTYDFIRCSLQNIDGSFYIVFSRKGENVESNTINLEDGSFINIQLEKPIKKLKKISYHASGQVNYHDTDHQSNYFEPISNITKKNLFVIWSIPKIKLLDEITSSNDDIIIQIDNDDIRLNFSFILIPISFIINEQHVLLSYDKLFSLAIIINSHEIKIDETLKNHFITISPSGLFEKQILSQKQALINFHQKINNTNELIVYTPNSDGIYTIITSVIMRIAPKLTIKFFDESYKIEIISCKEHTIKFKVKDKYGNVIKKEIPIENIILNSEL